MKRRDVAAQAKQGLQETELAVDRAWITLTGFASQLMQLRIDGGLSGVRGQEAINELASAMKDAASVRASVVRAHQHLVQVGVELGLGSDFGQDCPPDEVQASQAEGRPRLVA